MAYKTEIQIGVKGSQELTQLQKKLDGTIYKIDQLNKKQATAFGGLAQSLQNYSKQLSLASKALDRVSAGTVQETRAVSNYVTALGNANAARARQNQLIQKEVALRERAARIKALPQAAPGTQYAGPIGPGPAITDPRRIKEGQINFQKQQAAQQAASKNRAMQLENLALGAGFPLLFGGGIGQVAGGLAGSFIGTGFGGQILGSALGQVLEDAIVRIREIGTALRALDMDALRDSAIYVNAELDTTVRRLIEAGNAQEAQSVMAAAITEQTGLSAEAIERTTNNTNKLSNAWESVTAAYSGYLALVGDPLIRSLGDGLNLVSDMKVQTENIVPHARDFAFTMLGVNPQLLKGLNYLKGNKQEVKVLSEEEEKRLALITKNNDRLTIQNKNTKALLDIESQRIAATSVADKEHNANVDYQRQQELIKQQFAEKTRLARVATAGVSSEQVNITFEQLKIEEQLALAGAKRVHDLKLQNLEVEKQKEKEKELKELAKQRSDKYKEMAEDVKLQTKLLSDQAESLNYQSTITNNIASLANARRKTESDLLDLQISRLERQKDEAKHFLDKIKLNNIIIDKRKQQAKLEYESQLTSIKLSVAKAEQERIQIRLKEQQIKLQLEQVRLEAEAIQDADRRNAALNRINKQERSTLQVVKDMNRAADHSLETTRKIASFQQQSAKYAYQGKIEALETARQQERMAIFLNSQKGSMNSLASQSGTYASNMERAANAASKQIKRDGTFEERFGIGRSETVTVTTDGPIDKDIQQRIQSRGNWKSVEAMVSAMNAAQRDRDAGRSPAFGRYAEGGYATKPHIGMVGEAGPEYIVPERKAAAFATNYLMGARGAGAIPQYADGGYVGPINIQTGPVMQQDNERYVTMGQFEAGMRSVVNSMVNNRNYGARRYRGVS